MKVINAYAGELYRIMKSFDYPMDSPKELLQVSATDDEATLVAHVLRPNFNGRASVVLWSFHRGDSLEHLKEGCMSGVFPIGNRKLKDVLKDSERYTKTHIFREV